MFACCSDVLKVSQGGIYIIKNGLVLFCKTSIIRVSLRGHGEIGRRTGFRFQRRKAWEFESLCLHHIPYYKSITYKFLGQIWDKSWFNNTKKQPATIAKKCNSYRLLFSCRHNLPNSTITIILTMRYTCIPSISKRRTNNTSESPKPAAGSDKISNSSASTFAVCGRSVNKNANCVNASTAPPKSSSAPTPFSDVKTLLVALS